MPDQNGATVVRTATQSHADLAAAEQVRLAELDAARQGDPLMAAVHRLALRRLAQEKTGGQTIVITDKQQRQAESFADVIGGMGRRDKSRTETEGGK